MSKTTRRLEFGICIDDPERWTPEHLAECESAEESAGYDDWVVAQISAKMKEAAMQFIKDNPDLFCGEWMT